MVTGADDALRTTLIERLAQDGHEPVAEPAHAELLVCAPALPTSGTFADGDAGAWYAATAAPLAEAHAAVRAALPAMRRARSGRIVLLGAQAWPGDGVAGAARAGVTLGLGALAKTLGRELGPAGLLANGVALDPPVAHEAAAEAVAFLATPGAAAVTGQILHPQDLAS